MEPNDIFQLNFVPQQEDLVLILSDGKNELNRRTLPGDILKFMAAAQEQLDSLFENRIPFDRDKQREWGSLLSRTIFGDDDFLAPLFEILRDADDEYFRLIIGSAMPQVLQFPWEFCYLNRFDFLGASRRLVPVRMPIAKKLTRKAEIKGEPLKVLVYVCAPDDLPEDKALEYEREQEFILEIFDELERQGRVDLQTPPEGDLTSLERYLSEFKPHLLHISGHAIYEKGELAEQQGGFFLFETRDGLTDPVPTEDFCHIFQESHKPHLVVLSACQTAQGFLPGLPGMAQSLLDSGIPHVVGMNHSVPDLKATAWAQEFFHCLVQGESIHAAMGSARRRLFQDENITDASWGIPVLYSRDTFTRLTAELLPEGSATTTEMDEQENVNDVIHLRKGFIGRRRDQRELLKILRSGEKNTVIITAQGGEGKSVLAIRLAKILTDDDNYGLLVYKTPKYEDLFLEPFEPLIAASPELTELHRKHSDAEMLQILVQHVLPGQRLVLLLDNFEALLDEQNRFRSAKTRELIRSLLSIKTGPFRLLITSRREWSDPAIPDNALVYRLPSLSRAETIKKINRYSPINALTFEQKKDIHGKLGGSPKAIELLNGYFSSQPGLTWTGVKNKLPRVQEQMLDFITYQLCYRSLPDNAKLLIRRASLIDRPFLKDAFYFLAPELSREIKALIPGLLRVSLLQQLTDPRYRSIAAGSAIMYAVHPIVAAPLQQLLTEDERLTALRQAGSYFERQGVEISSNPLDLEAACDYYWKAGQAELAEELLFRYLQHFWDHSGQYSKMIQFAERAKKLSNSPVGTAKADNMKASALMNLGNYAAALRLFDESMKIKKDIGDRAGMASTIAQIANIFFHQIL